MMQENTAFTEMLNAVIQIAFFTGSTDLYPHALLGG